MADFDLVFQTPLGPRRGTIQAESVEAAKNILLQQGFQPLGYRPATDTTTTTQPGATSTTGAPSTTTTSTALPTTTTTRPQSLVQRLASAAVPTAGDLTQMGTEAAMLALPGGRATRMLAVPAGIAARTALGALRGGKGQAVEEGATGVVNTALTPVMRPLARAATALTSRTLPVLQRGVAGAAERLGIPLAAHEMLPSLGRVAKKAGEENLVESIGERQARGITTGVTSMVRENVGSIFEKPQAGATGLRSNLRGLLRRVPKGMRDSAAKQVFDDTGIDVSRITSRKLYRMIQSDPHLAVRALQHLGAAAGEGIEQQQQRVLRTYWSNLLDRSVRQAPSNLRFPGAFRGGFLDGKMVLSELQSLHKRVGLSGMQTLFGKDGVAAVNELTHVLGRASLGQKFLAREGLAKAEKMVAGEEMAKRGIRLAPFLAAASLAFAGHELPTVGDDSGAMGSLRKSLMVGSEIAGGFGAASALKSATIENPRFLAFLLTNPLGIRWLATGIRAMERGTPDALLVPTLSTSLAQLVSRLGSSSLQAAAQPPAALAPAFP